MAEPRPTIRCLWEDLLDGMNAGGPLEASIRDGRVARSLPHPSLRLGDLDHPVVKSLRDDFGQDFADHLDGGGSVPNSKQFSLGQSRSGSNWGMIWYKVRADDLRGLVCRVDGTFWLGWSDHRGGDYASFNHRKEADQHTGWFEPNTDDAERLALEEAWVAQIEQEERQRVWIAKAVFAARASGRPATESDGDGNSVEVELTDDGEGSVLISARVIPTVGVDAGDVYAAIVDSLPGIAVEDWEVDFGMFPSQIDAWAIIEESYLSRLAVLADEHGVDALVASPAYAADPSDGHCHVVTTKDHHRGYVDGALIRSVCGRRFTPSQNPDGFPACPRCAVVITALEG